MTDKTRVVFFVAVFCMTFGAVVHLHTIPGIYFIARNILTPNMDTVAGQDISPISRQLFGFVMVSVTGPALHFAHLYMGDVREIDAIRLSVIGKPGNFFFFGHISFQKILLFRGFAQRELRVLMAFQALKKPGDSCESPVVTEFVAIEALFRFGLSVYTRKIGIKMEHVIKIHGLGLFGIKDHRVDEPPDY